MLVHGLPLILALVVAYIVGRTHQWLKDREAVKDGESMQRIADKFRGDKH